MDLFVWNGIEQEQLNPRVARKVIHSANMTIARLEMQKGATVPEHSHINEQITMLEKGTLKFFMEGKEQVLRAGEALVIPPNVPHGVEVLEDAVAVDVFSPSRQDWIRGDDSYLRK